MWSSLRARSEPGCGGRGENYRWTAHMWPWDLWIIKSTRLIKASSAKCISTADNLWKNMHKCWWAERMWVICICACWKIACITQPMDPLKNPIQGILNLFVHPGPGWQSGEADGPFSECSLFLEFMLFKDGLREIREGWNEHGSYPQVFTGLSPRIISNNGSNIYIAFTMGQALY